MKDRLRNKIKAFFIIYSILFLFVQMVPVAFAAGPINIDHTCTNLSQIPDVWLEQAKSLTLHYAHTSHGSQITTGSLNLESQDSTCSVAIRNSTSAGLPTQENPPALRIYDGNPPETYITPEDYWDGDSGKDRTRVVANTGDYNFSMWSWCGEVSGAGSSIFYPFVLKAVLGKMSPGIHNFINLLLFSFHAKPLNCPAPHPPLPISAQSPC